jgi:bla regulator protein blaR1
MEEISQVLVTFVLNALWQVTAITALALFCTRLLNRMPSRFAHAVWVVALIACLLVPAATVLLQGKEGASATAAFPEDGQANRLAEPATRVIPVSFHSLSHSIAFSPSIFRTLLWMYDALLLFRILRLAWLGYRTWRVCQLAYARALPPSLVRIVECCVRSFSLPRISVLCCAETSGPATLGLRHPVLLLPESFFTDEMPADDLVSALSHELAHVQRRDFLFNLLYEVGYVPLSFHPCAALIMSRIAQSRELACDEIAAPLSPSAGQYARSLLHIAQSMFSGAGSNSNYALGLFDTNTLEDRIMNILKTRKLGGKRTQALRFIAVCLVGGVSLGLSAFSLRVSSDNNSADLQQFAGTWEAKYQGTTFFTLHLKLTNASLGGTCVHNDRLAWVDGELIPTGSEFSTEKILEASSSGKKLLMKIGNENSTDGFPLEFTLTAPGQAEAKIIAPSDSGTPPQKKPWHLQRVSVTP